MTLSLHIKHADALGVLHLRRVRLRLPSLPAPVPELPALAPLALRVPPEMLLLLLRPPLPLPVLAAAVGGAAGFVGVAVVAARRGGGGAGRALGAARLRLRVVLEGRLGGGVELLLFVLVGAEIEVLNEKYVSNNKQS